MARSAAKTVIFSFTGRALDVHAVQQSCEQVLDEEGLKANDGRLLAGSHSKNCLKLVFLDKKVSII